MSRVPPHEGQVREISSNRQIPVRYTAGENPGRLLRRFDPRAASFFYAVNP